MNGIILAVILTVLQTNPPVPRQIVGTSTNQQNSQQNKSASAQAPSSPTGPADEPSAADPDQQNAPAHAGKNTNSPEVVAVQGRPDITIHKDDFDYFYIVGSLLLTLITLIIAGIAWEQASAALLNAKAVINSERAYILLDDVIPDKIDGEIFNTPRGMPVPLRVHFKNHGKTPAWIIDSCCKFVRADVAEFQGPMDYGNAKPGGDYAVAPNGGIFPVFPEGDTPVIGLSDIERIRRGQRSLVLYGLVRYGDAFVNKKQSIRETYFCVHLLVYAYGPAANWQLAGPEGANRCT